MSRLFGISCVQVFHYFVAYGKDNTLLKVFVATTWFVDALYSGAKKASHEYAP